ncbi:MAG: PEGA domain-containing protein, partial [Bacteroidaceae bacterium]|nr:PEGA domain-containing protein [Bacteroidaceae bacterium]
GAASVPSDNNGNPCAKIIVELPLEDAVIEGTYIVGNVKEKAGRYEFYVSVPKKNGQKFSVRHSNYGSIDIPIWTGAGPLASREAYIVKLKATSDEKVIVDMHGNKVDVENKKVEVIVHDDAGGQYLVMKVAPADASVEIDGQFVPVNEGTLHKFLSYGKHSFKVQHPMYEPQNGLFDISDEKVNLSIDLAPLFGWLKISTTPESDADVYLNGKKIGKSPITTDALIEGEYNVRVIKEMYDCKENTITVLRNKTTDVDLAMPQAFSEVTINSHDLNATLTLDGKTISKGSWAGRIARGKHVVEAIRDNHRSTPKIIDIESNSQLSFELEAPTPIVGAINISSNPIGARIKIDGQDMGETPNIIKGLLIGNHTVSLSKHGCGDYENQITIEEGKITPLDIALEQGKEITITTNQYGDEIYIDDKLAGTSPLTISLSFGSHQVYAKRDNKKTEVENWV